MIYVYVALLNFAGLLLQSLLKIKKMDDSTNNAAPIDFIIKTFIRKDFFSLLTSIMCSFACMVLMMEFIKWKTSAHVFGAENNYAEIIQAFTCSISFAVGYGLNSLILKVWGTAESFLCEKFGLNKNEKNNIPPATVP